MTAEAFPIPSPMLSYPCLGSHAPGLSRMLPEETPVALVYCGSTEAVMMATPADLEDFGIGFSITEGLIADPEQIIDLTIVHSERGIEVRMWLSGRSELAYQNRRRRMSGPTGCGLCGIESLAEVLRPSRLVTSRALFSERDIGDAVTAVAAGQRLNHETHATHAAGFYHPGDRTVKVREDVGRHNALDKLAGALHRDRMDVAAGAIVITSRVSIEMVQKAAAIGTPLLIAMSVPTALAVRTATEAGLTLVAVARGPSYEVFSHPYRIGKRSDGFSGNGF
jgi:FdhD protein